MELESKTTASPQDKESGVAMKKHQILTRYKYEIKKAQDKYQRSIRISNLIERVMIAVIVGFGASVILAPLAATIYLRWASK